ncbi:MULTISPECIES: tyrosine-type recombinase/integrase [Trichocoleus]|uniref:Tyrosine-type recombinase/integrase n=1 Tax=Trichocoleus desertorum GB2-A4 TaxID=2933944 RepID=A0ABV0JDU2_9CYAN|nr:tyrosine-type recombinase/integrase [Trichocoleus sp. FACHB-46]MBD1865153.1 site-specific integrase [Trichocoleus sp. FACHB-46]
MASITIPKKFLQPKNLMEVLQNYEAEVKTESPDKASATLHQLQTALIRYTLPGWGLPHPQTNRVSAKEIKAAKTFMKKISLEQLKKALEVQMSVYEQLKVPSSSQRTYRHALNKLLEFCDDQNWWQSEPKVERRPLKQKDCAKYVRTTKRKRQEFYALGVVKGDVISEALQKQFSEFAEFVSEDLKQAPISVRWALQGAYQGLGWLYRYENVPLDELSLETLIQYVPLRTAIDKLPVRMELAERLLRQEEVRREAMQAADATEDRLRKYLSWIRKERKVHPGAEYAFLRACLNVAKFLYRFETNRHEVANYDDVPVIKRIRVLIRDVSKRQRTAPSPVDISKKWLPWEDWLQVVETLRKECCQATYICGTKRLLGGIAHSLQCYLMCAFFTYIPPMRQQVIRGLEVGHSLLWEDNRWYIYLRPDEYKTGKVYGEFRGPVSNPDLGDGTCFYDYIEAWLYDCSKLPGLSKLNLPGGLRATYNPEHNFFFTQKNREPMKQHTLSEYIRHAAYRIKGKAVTAHLLRDMFVSHLMELGYSDAEMNSVANAMHHSPETQRGIYDKRTKEKKVAPGMDLARQIAENAIKRKTDITD